MPWFVVSLVEIIFLSGGACVFYLVALFDGDLVFFTLKFCLRGSNGFNSFVEHVMAFNSHENA